MVYNIPYQTIESLESIKREVLSGNYNLTDITEKLTLSLSNLNLESVVDIRAATGILRKLNLQPTPKDGCYNLSFVVHNPDGLFVAIPTYIAIPYKKRELTYTPSEMQLIEETYTTPEKPKTKKPESTEEEKKGTLTWEEVKEIKKGFKRNGGNLVLIPH